MTSQCRCTRALSQSHVAKHDNHVPVAPLIGSGLGVMLGSWSKRPHPTRPQNILLPKRPHCIGQNGHRGRITTKTATLHLVKTATEGGSLPKRPHCIWSKATEGCSLPKRPHYSKMATETETLNMIPERGRITTKTATLLQTELWISINRIIDIHKSNYGYP